MSSVLEGSTPLWAAFSLVVLVMLAIDLGVLSRSPLPPTPREALAWSAVWVALATAFGVGVTLHRGSADGARYFTSYLLEKSLSVDNLLVMMLIVKRFGVPPEAERRVLGAGIVAAIVLRVVLVLAGAALVDRFHWLTYVLGALLAWAAISVMRGGEPKDAPGGSIVGRISRFLPITDGPRGRALFVVERGMLHATPVLLAVVAIEIADIVFAIDSIPAVLSVTTDPFLVVTSNVLAILGLRSLYFALSGLLVGLRFLPIGLGLALLFVAGKMLLGAVVTVPAMASLAVLVVCVGGAVVASRLYPSTEEGKVPDAR
jgi:tellurite resistance protein TerC